MAKHAIIPWGSSSTPPSKAIQKSALAPSASWAKPSFELENMKVNIEMLIKKNLMSKVAFFNGQNFTQLRICNIFSVKPGHSWAQKLKKSSFSYWAAEARAALRRFKAPRRVSSTPKGCAETPDSASTSEPQKRAETVSCCDHLANKIHQFILDMDIYIYKQLVRGLNSWLRVWCSRLPYGSPISINVVIRQGSSSLLTKL